MNKKRLRDLGISLGKLSPGPLNSITDIAGIKVGYSQIIHDQPHTIRTGVTALWPADDIFENYMFAGFHSFNGNGEMTGTLWLAEQGLLSAPIAITNTHSTGIVRDAICQLATKRGIDQAFHLPIAAETHDGWLSHAETYPITTQLALKALENAKDGVLAEGNVGGGTGMICHEFKGGTGTASRILPPEKGGYTIGALVQANYGLRPFLRCNHAPLGEKIGYDKVPSAYDVPRDTGSIIVILATDAPLLPIQCRRLAQRATTGLAWVGGFGSNSSGDIFLAFSTGNRIHRDESISDVKMLGPDQCTPLFHAAAEATEEAIWNALIAAETMVGWQGRIAHAIPHDLVQEFAK